MVGTLTLAASSLKAILCFIDATKTPKIAFDNDSLALPLIEKIKDALGNADGSQYVSITFGHHEIELSRQFSGVCKNIGQVFDNIIYHTTHTLIADEN